MTRSRPVTHQSISTGSRMRRALWGVTSALLYRPSPRPLHAWRRWLLRIFGARIGAEAHPYPRARIWAPWNLTMAEHSCLADDVDCYSVAPIVLGSRATVSQYTYLCTASHDYRDATMPMVCAPITIGADAWVAADVFVGPGVAVGEGAVVGARSTLMKDAAPWTVVAGSPARELGKREPLRS